MKRFGAVAITLIFLASLIMIIPQTTSGITAESGESVPVTLYFHTPDEMDTFVPTEPEENTSYVVLNDGDSVSFKTESLEKSLTIDTTIKPILSYHISIRVNGAVNIKLMVNLTFSFGDSTSRATSTKSHSVSGTGVLQLEDDFPVELDFDPHWSGIIQIGQYLQSEISSKVTTTGYCISYNVSMAYDSTEHQSHLSFQCAPVTSTIATYSNQTWIAQTEFEPNVLPDKASILFKGSIQNTFGSDDVISVDLKITGTHVNVAPNLTAEKGTKTGSYEYAWNYYNYRGSLVAESIYTANLTVKTVQNTFYQTANFSFSANGVYCTIDKSTAEEPEEVRPDETTSCYIEVINTGGSSSSMEVIIEQYPVLSERWNLSTGSHTTLELAPGGKHPIMLYITPPTGATTGSCDVMIKAKTSGAPVKSYTVWFYVEIVEPWEVNLTWAQAYSQPFSVISGYTYKFSIKVTNKGGSNDVFNLSAIDTEHWDVGLNRYTLSLERWHSIHYYDFVNLTVIPKNTGESENVINITGESQGAATYGEGVRYSNLSLRLTRILGIEMTVDSYTKSVDVKTSDGQTSFTITVSTNDDVSHTVNLELYNKDPNIKSALLDGQSVATVTVTSQSSQQVTLSATIKKGTLAGSYKLNVKAALQGMQMYNITLPITIVVNPYYTAELRYDNKTAIEVESASDTTLQYRLTIKNTGNANTTFDLRVVAGVQYNPTVYPDSIKVDVGDMEYVDFVLIVPKSAAHQSTLVISIDAREDSTVLDTITITIKVVKSDWEIFMDTLYQMSHFLILLMAVIVVFVALWIKRRK